MAMRYDHNTRLIIYAEGAFGRGRTKTADGVIRYAKNPVLGVVDSELKARRVSEVLPWARDIPILKSVQEAIPLEPEAMLLGLAPRGGRLPHQWRRDIVYALEHGMNIVSGLHDFLADDPELAAVAERNGRWIWDVRKPPTEAIVGLGLAAQVSATVVLTVGTDSALGKMAAAIEVTEGLLRRGRRALFVPTGQTGIMIAGFGVSIDAVVGDFMSGVTEKLVLDSAPGQEYLLVEGQGSLIHPGYSSVALSLLHGAAPSQMILCHKPSRKYVRDTHILIPPLDVMVRMHEEMASYVKPAKVVGIALNCGDLTESEAQGEIERAETLTGLPATDCFRWGPDKLVDAVLAAGQ